MSNRLLPLIVFLALTTPAAAEESWELRERALKTSTARFFADPRPAAPSGIPDARVASRKSAGTIDAAWYAAPTTRYRHGVLGDAIEAGALIVRSRGQTLRLDLPKTQVFEDQTPRIADLDGDGVDEVITIRASSRAGAAVTIYGVESGKLVQKATTPYIGRANRWLNIAAIAPFRGGAAKQIAYVETPHIGGTLRLWAYRDGDLMQIGRAGGFSNHKIGARELRLSAVADYDGDGRVELFVPSNNRRTLYVMDLQPGGWRRRAAITLKSPIAVMKATPIGDVHVLTEAGAVRRVIRRKN